MDRNLNLNRNIIDKFESTEMNNNSNIDELSMSRGKKGNLSLETQPLGIQRKNAGNLGKTNSPNNLAKLRNNALSNPMSGNAKRQGFQQQKKQTVGTYMNFDNKNNGGNNANASNFMNFDQQNTINQNNNNYQNQNWDQNNLKVATGNSFQIKFDGQQNNQQNSNQPFNYSNQPQNIQMDTRNNFTYVPQNQQNLINPVFPNMNQNSGQMPYNMNFNNMNSNNMDQELNYALQAIQNAIMQTGSSSVGQFFEPYDCYESRIYEEWEVQIIFGNNVNQQQLKRLSEENVKENQQNRKNVQLNFGAIEYTWIQNKLLSINPTFANNVRRVPNQSKYADQRIGRRTQEHLDKIAKQFQDPKDFFQRQFGNLRTQPDSHQIRGCFNACGITMYEMEEADEIVEYFTGSRSIPRLNSIQFVQGLLPFYGIREGYASARSTSGANRSVKFNVGSGVNTQVKMGRKGSWGGRLDTNIANTKGWSTVGSPSNGTQKIPMSKNLSSYSTRQVAGWNKNDNRYRDHFRNENLTINDVKPILLNMLIYVHQKNNVECLADFFQKEPQLYDNAGLHVYQFEQFISDMKSGSLQMSEKNASLLANYYLLEQSRNSRNKNDQFVNMDTFYSDYQKFDEIASNIINTNGLQIGQIRDAIIQKQDGNAWQYFKTYESFDGAMKEFDFIKAIKALNTSVSENDAKTIFNTILQQTAHHGENTLEISDFAAIIKVYWSIQMDQNPNLKAGHENTMMKILKAFNCDVDYLNKELPAKKDFKQFVQFFKQYITQQQTNAPQHNQQFGQPQNQGTQYTLVEIIQIATTFNYFEDKVTVSKFLKRISQLRNDKNFHGDPKAKGVHQTMPTGTQPFGPTGSQPYGPVGSQPINSNIGQVPIGFGRPQMSTKGTQAETQGKYPQRLNFQTKMGEQQIAELQKACFVKGMTIQAHFEKYTSQSQYGQQNQFGQQNQYAAQNQQSPLTNQDFNQAIQQLPLQWNQNYNIISTLWQEVQRSMSGGSMGQNIYPAQIDEYILNIATNTLEQLHSQLIYKIMLAVNQNNINVVQIFANFTGAHSNSVSTQQLQQILQNQLGMREMWDQLDFLFLAAKYVQGMPNSNATHDQVMFQGLIDDINNAKMGNTNSVNGSNPNILPTGQATEPYAVLAVIKKAYQAFDIDLNGIFAQYPNAIMQKQQFTQLLSGQNMLMVPNEISHQGLEKCFDFIDNRRAGYIDKNQFESALQTQGPDSQQLINDTIQKISASSHDIKNAFQGNAEFSHHGGKVQFDMLSQMLQKYPINLSPLNALYLARFYRDKNSMYANANNLIADIDRVKLSQPTSTNPYQPIGKGPQGTTQMLNDKNQLMNRITQSLMQKKLDGNSNWLTKYASQNHQTRQLMVTTQYFRQALVESAGLNQIDLDKLEQFFKIQNDPYHVNYIQFLDELKQTATPSLPKLEKRLTILYDKFKRFLVDNKLQGRFTYELRNKEGNQMPTGYLEKALIHQTITNIIGQYQTQAPSMNENDKQAMIQVLKNQTGHVFSYQQMLQHLFGVKEAGTLMTMNLNALLNIQVTGLNSAGPTQSVIPSQPKNPANGYLGNICIKLIRTGIDFEEKIANRIKSVQDQDKIFGNDIEQAIQECNVFLDPQEAGAIQSWIQEHQGYQQQNPVDPVAFLDALGWGSRIIRNRQKVSTVKHILTRQELVQSQEFLKQVRLEMHKKSHDYNKLFVNLKDFPNDLSISTKKFNNGLKEWAPITQKSMTNNQIYRVIDYLVQEDKGKISLNKLSQAFALHDNAQPLPQHGIQELKKYQDAMVNELEIETSRTGQTPPAILHLLGFIKSNGLNIDGIFGQNANKIQDSAFFGSLRKFNYNPVDQHDLIKALAVKGTNNKQISIVELKNFQKKNKVLDDQQSINNKLQHLPHDVRNKISIISEYLQKNGQTVQQMHEQLDSNKDGFVTKEEFTNEMPKFQTGLTLVELSGIFDAIDINKDNSMSVNEFGMYVTGAKISREQMVQNLTLPMKQKVQNEIQRLFNQFDKDNDGTLTKDEIYQTMKSMGYEITIIQAGQMIAQIDHNKTGVINLAQFSSLMEKPMLDHIFSAEVMVEDLRDMFREADTDYSGYLTIGELYTCIMKQGMSITKQELINLVTEFDVDRNGKIEIDEFVEIMTSNNDHNIDAEDQKNTLFKLRRARKLNAQDFMKAFGSMPETFRPSFFKQAWTKERKQLPSCGLKPVIDINTFKWKDLRPAKHEDLTEEYMKKGAMPKIQPVKSILEGEIRIDGAEGVPLPAQGSEFDRNTICKRAIRVGLYNSTNKHYIANTAQVVAEWSQTKADIWECVDKNILNPIMFRTTEADNLDPNTTWLIFEILVYVKSGKKTSAQEFTCGWAYKELNVFQKRQDRMKLQIYAGTPKSATDIKSDDIDNNRSGALNALKSIFTSKDKKSQLTISINKVMDEYAYHNRLLPSTCLVNRTLVPFVAGFRNYVGSILIPQEGKQPAGSQTISAFEKIMDNIDVLEEFARIYSEDFWERTQAKKNIDTVQNQSVECINRIYPLFYSDAFEWSITESTDSKIVSEDLMRKRREMIDSALRFNVAQTRKPAQTSIEQMTKFKPFNIKEMEFQIQEGKPKTTATSTSSAPAGAGAKQIGFGLLKR